MSSAASFSAVGKFRRDQRSAGATQSMIHDDRAVEFAPLGSPSPSPNRADTTVRANVYIARNYCEIEMKRRCCNETVGRIFMEITRQFVRQSGNRGVDRN